jgi:hypothetical protein
VATDMCDQRSCDPPVLVSDADLEEQIMHTWMSFRGEMSNIWASVGASM